MPALREFGIEQIQQQPIVSQILSIREREFTRARSLRHDGGDYFRPR